MFYFTLGLWATYTWWYSGVTVSSAWGTTWYQGLRPGLLHEKQYCPVLCFSCCPLERSREHGEIFCLPPVGEYFLKPPFIWLLLDHCIVWLYFSSFSSDVVPAPQKPVCVPVEVDSLLCISSECFPHVFIALGADSLYPWPSRLNKVCLPCTPKMSPTSSCLETTIAHSPVSVPSLAKNQGQELSYSSMSLLSWEESMLWRSLIEP